MRVVHADGRRGGSSFEIRVTVTSAGLTGSDTHLVSVSIAPLSLSASVSGDSYLYQGQTGYWWASASGGNGTYTYQWQYRSEFSSTWSNVGTNASSYSRSAGFPSFYVRVIVTSGGVSATSEEYYVYVQPSEPECGGPGQMICP